MYFWNERGRLHRNSIHTSWYTHDVCVCGRVPCSHLCRCRSEAQGASTSRFGCRWCHSNYNIHVKHQQASQRSVDYNNKPRHVTVDVIRVQTRTHMHISCVFQFTSDRFMRNHGLHSSEVLSTTIRQGMWLSMSGAHTHIYAQTIYIYTYACEHACLWGVRRAVIQIRGEGFGTKGHI